MAILPFAFQKLRPIMFCMYDAHLSRKMYGPYIDPAEHETAMYFRRMIPILRKLELV